MVGRAGDGVRAAQRLGRARGVPAALQRLHALGHGDAAPVEGETEVRLPWGDEFRDLFGSGKRRMRQQAKKVLQN